MKLNLILAFLLQSFLCFGQWSNYSNNNTVNGSEIEYKISLIADGSVYRIKNNDNQYNIEKITSCQNNNSVSNHIIYSKTVNHCGANKLNIQLSPDQNVIIIKTPNQLDNDDKIINIYLKPKTYERVSDTDKPSPKKRKKIAWYNNDPLA